MYICNQLQEYLDRTLVVVRLIEEDCVSDGRHERSQRRLEEGSHRVATVLVHVVAQLRGAVCL